MQIEINEQTARLTIGHEDIHAEMVKAVAGEGCITLVLSQVNSPTMNTAITGIAIEIELTPDQSDVIVEQLSGVNVQRKHCKQCVEYSCDGDHKSCRKGHNLIWCSSDLDIFDARQCPSFELRPMAIPIGKGELIWKYDGDHGPLRSMRVRFTVPSLCFGERLDCDYEFGVTDYCYDDKEIVLNGPLGKLYCRGIEENRIAGCTRHLAVKVMGFEPAAASEATCLTTTGADEECENGQGI